MDARRPIVLRLGPESAFFLDSSNLTDLSTLLESVTASANLILLLSKEVLERPYVLAELCVAHQSRVSICVVLIEFTAKELDSRAFRFPELLEQAIEEVSWFILHEVGTTVRGARVGASLLQRWSSTRDIQVGRLSARRPRFVSDNGRRTD